MYNCQIFASTFYRLSFKLKVTFKEIILTKENYLISWEFIDNASLQLDCKTERMKYFGNLSLLKLFK